MWVGTLRVSAATPRSTGKERDTESGNDYFGARYYNSNTGRFLSPDWSTKVEPVPYVKLDNPQSLNLYSYMLNNPLGGVDLDGHDGCSVKDVEVNCSSIGKESVAVETDQTVTVTAKASKWWNIGSKIKDWFDKGSKLHGEIKEMNAWTDAMKRDEKIINSNDVVGDNFFDKTITGESLNLVNARFEYERAVSIQGWTQIAKDMVHDTDSFGLPESRLGIMAVVQMRTLSSGFADGAISASVQDKEQLYVNALAIENGRH